MRIEEDLHEGTFLSRPNRFTVVLEGGKKCHLRDPGRLRELLVPGARILYAPRTGIRRTDCEVFGVFANGRWVLVNSGIHSNIAVEAIEAGMFPELGKVNRIVREVKVGGSRIDLLADSTLIEVKGCTLVVDGLALFPDAPTGRGRRHVEELEKYVEGGGRAFIMFLIARDDAEFISPNWKTDPRFSETLFRAFTKGVGILAFKLRFTGKEAIPLARVPVILPSPL